MCWTVLNGASILSFEFGRVTKPSPCVSGNATELTILLDGEITIEYGPARQHVRLKPYDACLVTRGTPHRSFCTPGTRVVVVDVFADGPELGIGKLGPRSLEPTLLRRAEQYCEGTLKPDDFAECRRQAEARLLPVRSMEHSQSSRRMLEVKRLLDQNYAESINVAAIAEHFRLDTDYMIREFRKSFYFTPFAYVNFLRLQLFSWTRLQLGATTPMIRSALDAGFNDYATFCRRVRARYGLPPSRLYTDLQHPAPIA